MTTTPTRAGRSPDGAMAARYPSGAPRVSGTIVTEEERVPKIQSTHVGSLIRPPELLRFEAALQRGEPYDEAEYASTLRACVAHVVRRQAEAGIDVVSDGEFGKANWISYLYDRVSGIEMRSIPEGETRMPPSRDRQAFPGAYAQHDAEFARSLADAEVPAPAPTVWVCTGPIS